MNFSPKGISLREIEYPAAIQTAAKGILPGSEVSLAEALQASIRLSVASPTQSKILNGETLHDGPFGAIRLAVKADKMIHLLLSLQEKGPEEIVETLLQVKAQVISLGWNSVNGATRPEVFRDENAHAEMLALRNAGMSLPLSVASLPDHNICFIETSSSENCDACRERNRMWGSTALSLYALLTRQVVEQLGFDEGDTSRIDQRDVGTPHVKFGDFSLPHLETTFVYAPGLEEEATKAFDIYKANMKLSNTRRYQADYSEIINRQRNLLERPQT